MAQQPPPPLQFVEESQESLSNTPGGSDDSEANSSEYQEIGPWALELEAKEAALILAENRAREKRVRLEVF